MVNENNFIAFWNKYFIFKGFFTTNGFATAEENTKETIREILMTLQEADVNYEVAKEFTKNVKEKALDMIEFKNSKANEVFIKLKKDELELLSDDYVAFEIEIVQQY